MNEILTKKDEELFRLMEKEIQKLQDQIKQKDDVIKKLTLKRER